MTDCRLINEISDKWERLMIHAIKYKAKSDELSVVRKQLERISHRQLDILISLRVLNINTVSELAAFLNISKSTLSIVINKLVAKGYVTKRYPDDGGDGRKVYFELTPKGNDIFEELGIIFMDSFGTLYNSFAAERQALFREGVACLRQATNARATLFASMIGADEYTNKYGEELVQAAKDIAFFLVNCKFGNFSGGKPKMPGGITQNQFHLLLCVYSGIDTVTKLEKHLGSSGSTLSIGVSKLVEKGLLLKRYPGVGQDGRNVFLSLTDTGDEILCSAKELGSKLLADFLESLGNERLAVFNHACDCLLEAFDEKTNIN